MPHTIVTVATIAVMPTFINFLNEKVQSHREQQKNDTDVRPYFDIGRIGNSRDQRNGRTRHNTGYNVAQYDRLLQPLENDGYNTGNNQNYGKIRY